MCETPWMPDRWTPRSRLPGLLDAFLWPEQIGAETPRGAYVATAGQRADHG